MQLLLLLLLYCCTVSSLLLKQLCLMTSLNTPFTIHCCVVFLLAGAAEIGEKALWTTLTADGVEVSLPQTNSARIAYLHHKLLLVCRGGRVRLLLEGSRQDSHAQVGLRPATTIPPPEQWLFIS